MDFSYPIEPALYIMPRDYPWHGLASLNKHAGRYSFIGIGQETDGLLGFFDGVNERGFAAATLYFEGYADYGLPGEEGKEPIVALDFFCILY